jgi:hypothetical protein
MLNCDHSESAATLEAESGYSMEAPEVSDFRQYILDGSWGKAEAALIRLAVSDEEGLWVCFHQPNTTQLTYLSHRMRSS